MKYYLYKVYNHGGEIGKFWSFKKALKFAWDAVEKEKDFEDYMHYSISMYFLGTNIKFYYLTTFDEKSYVGCWVDFKLKYFLIRDKKIFFLKIFCVLLFTLFVCQRFLNIIF